MASDACLCYTPDRRELKVRVVLRHKNEKKGCTEANLATNREVEPGRGVRWRVQQHPAQEGNTHGCKGHRDFVTTLQHLHWVHVLARWSLRHHNANAAHNQVHSMDGKREEYIATLHIDRKILGKSATKDHGCEDLTRNGLKQVSTSSGTVAYIVSDQVSNCRRITRIILRDVCLNLSNHVCTDICSLGVDATTQLRKESNQ
mmetsp:Transcript_29531/g.57962  ORF Transcript_29531/g.57962 Transcript_29531/m.57962 type:complete len:202 (-) Transcript_29531:852-1457(-)